MINLISDSIDIIKKAGVSKGQILKVSFSFLSFTMEIIGIGIFIPIINLVREPKSSFILETIQQKFLLMKTIFINVSNFCFNCFFN